MSTDNDIIRGKFMLGLTIALLVAMVGFVVYNWWLCPDCNHPDQRTLEYLKRGW